MSDAVLRGRAAIAQALNVSEKTVTRWRRAGVLRAWPGGPFENSPTLCKAEEAEAVRRKFDEGEGD
jgi:predicted site-specific integrase-resolvase